MKRKHDRLIEGILAKRKALAKIPRVNTMQLVIMEAKRRAREDGDDRIIYMKPNDVLGIRTVGKDKSGDQNSLCYVRHDGKVIELTGDQK